ncbi:MAG: fucose isomerase [Candidatus Aminicenantes bacterium]|nr:fucose isomerase [Candidatus Aminicenantes bacterium]
MINIPEIRIGMVAVSRDCFPIELSRKRKEQVIQVCLKQNTHVVPVNTIIENEKDVITALKEIKEKQINALVVYLGNFGPEGPTTLLAKQFEGPCMFTAAAEEPKNNLIQDRGDAFCGLLNASYNMGLRNLAPYIPHFPVGTAQQIADLIKAFIPIARIVKGVKGLKVFSFGPRPQDFLACNAPIKPLYELGVEIMENSELDLFDIYRRAEKSPEISGIVEEMTKELGPGNQYPDLLKKLAQYEWALRKFYDENLGASEYGVFANKCWPAFESYFGFVPCYVNSRLASMGIPVACEVDIYGALSEFMAMCATEFPATLLDINNTVPQELYKKSQNKVKGYKMNDLFMGFHCGNTPSCCLIEPQMKYQLIMNRLLEDGKEPDITRGTLEGRIKPGQMTLFRLQSTADAHLRSYIAEGEILDIDPGSFGSTGVFAVKEMARFYRYVLLEERFPHHTAVAFRHMGKSMYEAVKMLGVKHIRSNQPEGVLYEKECPFS